MQEKKKKGVVGSWENKEEWVSACALRFDRIAKKSPLFDCAH